MAKIQTTIQVNDEFSKVLDKFENGMKLNKKRLKEFKRACKDNGVSLEQLGITVTKNGRIFDEAGYKVYKFNKAINDMKSGVKKAAENSAFKSLIGKMKELSTMGTAMAMGNIVAMGAIAVANGVKTVTTSLLEMASDVDELENITNQVFGGMAEDLDKWATELDKRVGRSVYSLKNYAGMYGAMFKGMGFDVSFFDDMSKKMAVLTADFSSFFNVADEEAFTALKGALTGETEALKRFGIILNDATMAEYAHLKGIKTKWAELDNATKMQLRYNKLMEMTNFIHGDAERTIDGYANQLKKAQGLIHNIGSELGKRLIPSAEGTLHAFNGIAEAIDNLLKKKSISDFTLQFIEQRDELLELRDTYKEYCDMVNEGTATPESEKERLRIYQQLIDKYPTLLGQISSEVGKYGELANAINNVISRLKEKILLDIKERALSEGIQKAEKSQRKIQKLKEENFKSAQELEAKTGIRLGEGSHSQEVLDKLVRTGKINFYGEEYGENRAENIKVLKEHGFTNVNKNNYDELRIYQKNKMGRDGLEFQEQENVKKIAKEAYEKGEKEAQRASEFIDLTGVGRRKNKKDDKDIENANTIQNMKNEYKNTQDKKDKLNLESKTSKDGGTQKIEISFNKNLDDTRKMYADWISKNGGDNETAEKLRQRISKLEKEENKKTKKEKEKPDILKEYFKDLKNLQIENKLLKVEDKENLKDEANLKKSYVRKAVDNNKLDFAQKLSDEVAETEFQIKKIDFSEALEELQKDLEELDIKHSKGELTDEEYNQKTVDRLERFEPNIEELEKFVQRYNKYLTEQEKQVIQNLRDKKELSKEELETLKEINRKRKEINDFAENLQSFGASLTNIGNITGSSKLQTAGNIMGNLANISSAMNTLKAGPEVAGSMANLQAASGIMGTASSAMAMAGPIAMAVGAGLSIVQGLNSKDKAKSQAIEQRNQEQLQKFEENTREIKNLTEQLKKNTEMIKNFSLDQIKKVSKAPTLEAIKGGERNDYLMYESLMNGKHFKDIEAIERGEESYRTWYGKKKSVTTYTDVQVDEHALLKYFGFKQTELDKLNRQELANLKTVIDKVDHNLLRRVTGRDLTKSTIEDWKNQVKEFIKQIEILETEKDQLFRSATLENFEGVEFLEEKELFESYKKQFEDLGLVGEQYNETIKELVKNNSVLISSMGDVRTEFIRGDKGFLGGMQGYFEKIFQNAKAVFYDTKLDDINSYYKQVFQGVSEKMVEIKKSGNMDFSSVFDGVDFSNLKNIEALEKQAQKTIDDLKQSLLRNGVDINIINQILPSSDFSDRVKELSSILSSAMEDGLKEKSYTTFTEKLGENLYNSTKDALVKAFSQSNFYQGLIKKFIKAEDFEMKLDSAGSYEEAFKMVQDMLGKFGEELEASGLGGFDAVKELTKKENILGNAYYSEKQQNVEFIFNNTYNGNVYGLSDFENLVRKITTESIEKYNTRPKTI